MAEFLRNNSGSKELSRNNDKLSLLVTECSSTSFSEVYLSQSMMTKHFWNGDSKVLLGKDGFRTACTLFTDPALNDDDAVLVTDEKIKISSVIRAKLGVSVGDSVTILKDENIPDGKIVCVRPFEECPGDLESVNLFEAYLRPYFKDAFRPVHIGDVFPVTRNGKQIKFRITNVDPSPFCTVGPGTSIRCTSFNSEELKTVESIREALSAPIKEDPEEPEPEITFLKVVPAPVVLRLIKVLPIIEPSSANIGCVKNRKTDKELEQSDSRSGSSTSNKHFHNVTVNSSEGNARSSCQVEEIADPLKRKHSGDIDMAQATTKSRKSEEKMNAAVSTTTTNDGDDDDWGGESSSLVSSSFAGKSVSISLDDEDDWDSSASANSSSQASASGRSASISTTTTNNDDWRCGNKGGRGGVSHFGDSRRLNSFNSNNDPWNNNRSGGGRGIVAKGRGGVECSSFSSAYDDQNRGRRNRCSFGHRNNDDWPRRSNVNNFSKPEEDDWGLGDSSIRYSNSGYGGDRRDSSYGGGNSIRGKRGDRGGGRGRDGCGYGGRGNRGGNFRGFDGNRGGRGFRDDRGPDMFQNRGNNNSHGARSQTVTWGNIADADEDWDTPDTPLLAPTPAPVASASSRTRSSSEVDDWSAPTGSSQLEDHAAGKPQVQPNNPIDQCEIQSAKEEIHKVKPKPTELSGCSLPLPKLMEVHVGNWSEKSTDCEQEIVHNPPAAVDIRNMHQNCNSEPSLNEEELSAQHQRALSLFSKAQFTDALSGFKIVLDKRTTLLGSNHADTLRSHFFVGRCLFKQKKVLEAKNILEQVLKIQKLVLPTDHGNIEETEFAVAKCFDSLGKNEDAEALYRILCAKTNKRLGPRHRSALITQYNLAQALDKQNKLDDAIKWYATFIELGVQYLGPEDELVLRGQKRIKHLTKFT